MIMRVEMGIPTFEHDHTPEMSVRGHNFKQCSDYPTSLSILESSRDFPI
jgi:hypothetical protein